MCRVTRGVLNIEFKYPQDNKIGDAMDWTNIIMTLITSGAFTAKGYTIA